MSALQLPPVFIRAVFSDLRIYSLLYSIISINFFTLYMHLVDILLI